MRQSFDDESSRKDKVREGGVRRIGKRRKGGEEEEVNMNMGLENDEAKGNGSGNVHDCHTWRTDRPIGRPMDRKKCL